MVKRTVEISTGPTYLHVERDQLVIVRDKREVGRVPIEDLGFLIVDEKAVTYTHSVFTRILHHGGIVVLCDDSHTPAGLMLSMHDNDLTARRMRRQAAMSLPRRKRLWQQIVRHKVVGQALNLPADHPARARLLAMAGEVKSGDTSNIEGQAARFYFPALFGDGFRRDPDGPPPNPLLNYGYMVFRAACARALVAGGLHPVFSLQHAHRNNTFALADDLVEIFRPTVDRTVKALLDKGAPLINRDSKQDLLSLLAEPIYVGGAAGPLMVQLSRIVASLVECVEGRADRLDLPEQPTKGVQLLPARFKRRPEDEE
jgi:CRISPR-associated protein Cas1